MEKTYVRHAGIKGMKWGVRRYQNADGSLTPAGKKRYGDKQPEPEHADYTRAHSRGNVKSMSDQELNSRINRLQKEKQYADLTKKTSKGKQAVKKAISVFVGTAATATSIAVAYKQYKKLARDAKPMADRAIDNVLKKHGDKLFKVNFSGPLTS